MKKSRELAVCDAITELRNHLGLNRQVFATNLGISMASLANYEKEIREPPVETLWLLASVAQKAGYRDFADFLALQSTRKLLALSKEIPLSIGSMDLQSEKGH